MTDTAVVNASPLIFLARGGHSQLLNRFYEHVLVPSRVAKEILARGSTDVTAQVIANSTWIEVVEDEPIPLAIAGWSLGPGESAVLSLAQSRPKCEVIIDDLAGRKCALSLGLTMRGTLGIVLLAKKRRLIAEARPVLEGLLEGGMYLSRSVLDEALRRVGE